MAIKKVALLTGGGDCPGLNAVIRAVTRTCLANNIEVVGFIDGFKGLVENDYMTLNSKAVSGILNRGGTILGTTNRDNPFEFRVPDGKGGIKKADKSDQAIANLHQLGVEALVVIGGDGSLNIAYELNKKGVPVVGVPKTIDNDLSATDVTFGFNTAVDTATEALDRLHTTAESHHRVMILEVMGRYAGWIALCAGLAGGADIILIPEIPYNLDMITAKISQRTTEGKKFSIVVVAEGAHSAGGDMVVQRLVDSHDPVRLGGIGNQLAEQLETSTGMETRVTVLGHLQRGGVPVTYDRLLSTRYGVAAAKAIISGLDGVMVSLQGQDIITVPLADAIGEIKKVPPQGELVNVARAIGICVGD
ncbi:MAG: 6-phosphofructokinase [Methylocystaceae bacterium]